MDLSEKILQDFMERVENAFAEFDNNIYTDLYHNDSEYAALRKEILRLQKAYPNIIKLIDGNGSITLTEEEHVAFIEYMNVTRRLEDRERRQIYFRGHADGFAYLKKIGVL